MNIGERLRALRSEKNLSQGDIELRTGLIRCYTSRVENGHTVPALETLEKHAHAFGVPLYQLFYDGEQPPEMPKPQTAKGANKAIWESSGRDARTFHKFRMYLSHLSEADRKLLLHMARKMSQSARRKS